MRKFQQFAGHGFFQTVNAGDAVADFNYRTYVIDAQINLIVLNLLFYDRRNFFRPNFHSQSVTSILVASLLSRTPRKVDS